MASPTGRAGEDASTPSNPLRRERAPTITIDTSAVNQPPSPTVPRISTERFPEDHEGDSNNLSPNKEQPDSDLHPAPSFESRDSRPISPHNVSSPTSRWGDSLGHNFLAVPGARSRGSSIDSSEPGYSSSSYGGDTYVHSEAHSPEAAPHDLANRNENIMNAADALEPDTASDPDFVVENNKFAFPPGQLNKLINPKSMAAFWKLGGLVGLEKGLRTNRYTGLSLDETVLDGTISFEEATQNAEREIDSEAKYAPPKRSDTSSSFKSRKAKDDAFADRIRIYKDNRLPEKKAKTIWELAWLAYNDKVLILLTIAAVISLALGIYQSITATDGEARVQWVEGVAIIVAIVIVVVVGAANDWQKERQFVKLNKKKDDRSVKVIRSGKSREISIHDVLVGDVMHLEAGDLIPVDGIFISGYDVKCDESSATGESDILRKTPADEVYKAIANHEPLHKMDPFIVSGGKVSEGVGTFMVTSVGVNSSYGKTMMSLQDEGQTTPLQSKLNVLAEYIAKLGLASGLLLFVVLFIKFLVQLKTAPEGAKEKGQDFLQIFIVSVTVVVVAVPEGLPLAVTLALAFATTRMLRDNNLVRLLRACETMGNATTICSDKTGTLTENKMTVVSGSLGTSSRFGDKATSADAELAPDASDVGPQEFVKTLAQPVFELLKDSIVANSTAFEGEIDGVPAFIGSKTESALLGFAKDYMGLGPVAEERANEEVVQLIPFDSARKCMAVTLKLANGKYRLLVKGAAEILLMRSSKIIRDPTSDVIDTAMTEDDRTTINQIITTYADRSLRAIALLYRDYEQWPPRGAAVLPEDSSKADFDSIFKGLTFLGVFGIQDPLRAGVEDAVLACKKAGVFVRMVTGDNINTAKAIASECGIFTPGGIAMEGPVFRKLSERQMDQVLPRLQVLARSSPNDKKVLVSNLKRLGETVAVTGDGTNDAPALKTADVGFSMGIAGTEVAKEASAIILMDDNFSSIVKAISWGRTVNDAVKKFLQFQITVNITAVVLTFVSAVSSGDENSVLTAVQLLWVNLIMDTFAALALATDPPNSSVLLRKPEPKSAPLITVTMWKMIIGQAIYQLVVTFIINFGGTRILGYSTNRELDQLDTIVFNTFVWMQIFNQYNSRRLDNKFNIFEGMFRNYWFLGIQLIIVAGQVLIIFVGGAAFAVHELKGVQWAYCLILGALSMPMAVVIRLLPDEIFQKLIPHFGRGSSSAPQLLVTDEQRYAWNPALEEIREELTFLKKVRGGRLSQLRYKLQHPSELITRSRSNSRSNSIPQTPVPEGDDGASGVSLAPTTPASDNHSRTRLRTRSRSNSAFGPAAAMAGMIAGSIAAGWSPVDRQAADQESIRFSRRSRSHSGVGDRETAAAATAAAKDAGLGESGIEIHPDTADDDPVIVSAPVFSLLPPSQNPELAPSALFEVGARARRGSAMSGISATGEAEGEAKKSSDLDRGRSPGSRR